MNAQESQLDYPFGDTLPPPGTTLEVAPGVRWLRMKLPFALDHINLWLLRDALSGDDGPVEGWTIVDCGITNDETRASWERIFASPELEGLPIVRVIVTHMHPDHMGLAHWLTERWNARLWISATDYNAARLASSSTITFGGRATADFMARHGLVDAESHARIAARTNYYSSMVPEVPSAYRRLLDGQTVQAGPGNARAAWTCQAGYGHAPEHMSLFRAGSVPGLAAGTTTASSHVEAASRPVVGVSASQPVLISGDMVLPRISTNVSVVDIEPEANPLLLYLDSLKRMRETLPADTLVLPSHGRPFRGLHTRIDQLVAHHDERFAEVMAACAEAPQSAADLLPVLFKRKLDLHQTTFAMGEAIAHLHLLWHRGELRREAGSDGVLRFAPA